MKYQNEKRFEELAARLEIERGTLLSSEMRTKYTKIIDRCRDGSYHDFATELATPKMEMINDLRDAHLNHDAQNVMNGDYDQ